MSKKILEVEMCGLVLFPVLVYFVRQSSLLFPLSCLSKTSWSRGQAEVDQKILFLYWLSHPTIPSWGISISLFTFFVAVFGWQHRSVSAGQSYLQYSVPLVKVRHVALFTQGALSSIHCRAARDKTQVREWTIRGTLHLLDAQSILDYLITSWASCVATWCTTWRMWKFVFLRLK